MHEVRTGNDGSAGDGEKTSAWAYKAHVLHSMQEGAAIHFIRKEETMAKNVQDLLGVCKGCGQTMMVVATSQEQADEIATERCDCPAGEMIRKKKELDERLGELIGEEAPQYGWDATTPEIFEAIRQIGHIVSEGKIESVGIRIDKTSLRIANRGGKIVIERSKTVKQGGSIDK